MVRRTIMFLKDFLSFEITCYDQARKQKKLPIVADTLGPFWISRCQLICRMLAKYP